MQKIEVVCVQCGKKFLKFNCRIKRALSNNIFCSRKCYRIWNKNPKNHPNYITGKSILNICKCGKPMAFQSKQCQDCYMNTKRTGRNLPHCLDCGKKLSMYKVQRCASCAKKGKLNINFGKVFAWRGKRFKYKDICLRSSYELGFAKYLDKNNIKWLYEAKTFDLGDCTYTPDFYLPETDEYIEIKGWQSPIFKDKLKIFKQKYIDIKYLLLTRKDLTKMNVLNTGGYLL